MIEVIPAILETDFAEIEKKIHLVEGLVDWVQIDLADGTLVPATTFSDPEPFAKFIKTSQKNTSEAPPLAGRGGKLRRSRSSDSSEVKESKLNFELHLMVADPLRYLERFAAVGFKRFFAHVEGDFADDYIAGCFQLGVEVGLAIDGPTPFEKIAPYLGHLDAVLVMAIEAGASGRPFRQDTIGKIKKIRGIDLEIPIAVDGAMDEENAKKVVEAGATRINSNSYIFNSPDVKAAIEKLKGLNPKSQITNTK